MTFQEDAKFGVNGMKNKVSFLRNRGSGKVEKTNKKKMKIMKK